MPLTESKKRANAAYSKRSGYASQRKYLAENIVKKSVSFNRNTDADILEYLETVPNFAVLVKSLIRNEIKKN